MKETELKIQTNDGHIIYGTFSGLENKSDSLIIFVHGFTGSSQEHIFYNTAQVFPKNGFDVVRFNLYWFEDNSRKLNNTTVTEHVLDFETVINYFKKDYKKIYAIGHSLGAQVVVRSGYNGFTSVVLWEPSQEVDEMCKSFTYIDKIDTYIEHSNVDIIVGKNFVEDAKLLPKIKDVVSKINHPVMVIGAENAGSEIAENLYFKNINSKKKLHIIKNASHTFEELGTEKELFNETLKWLKDN
jgi:esterase/lipase